VTAVSIAPADEVLAAVRFGARGAAAQGEPGRAGQVVSDLAIPGPPGRPILVTGMPRSGTTWVGRLLCAGNGAGYLNEPFNLSTSPGTIRVPVGHWFRYVSAENENEIVGTLEPLLRFEYPLGRELRRCRTYVDLLHTLRMWRSFVRARGRRALVKEPHAVFSADWFARRLGSDVVVTVRHPAAVVSSWKRLDWSFDFAHLLQQPALVRDLLGPFRSDMERALDPSHDLVDRVALLWHVVYRTVADYRERFPAFHVVRQEDLSRGPVDGYRALYEALGLPLTREAEDAIAAASSAANPKEPSVERPHETHLDSRATLESWKRRLSDGEADRIRNVTEETAALFYGGDEWD
jgi:Sulfotransferase domain